MQQQQGIKSRILKYWMARLAVVLLLATAESCSWIGPKPSFDDDFTTYRISNGNHEIDGNHITLFSGTSLNFQTIFDSTAIYQTVIAENQYDINKLMGFSDCNSPHHENSARFGWNWYADSLHIFAYTYKDAQRITQELGTVALGEINTYSITIQDDQYIFALNGNQTTMQRHCSGGVGIAYTLLPYFGGDEPAPQDISIKIRLLD
ncbi:hypothetical protein CLV98_103222 [Dyadobacter jejuensis]|uniref:Uncharacterized protein n=1 Tax=Dyadobacter jejuensis TaxID=1082580 RepID=A0A316AM47_9BACT|nr:hypothetical protein [Dyadobacter jejuensis]PWJ58855.1 hypothetical protein CLV98_103222 [Dyadobacter jejuensis]